MFPFDRRPSTRINRVGQVTHFADQNIHDENGEQIASPLALGGDSGYRADWIDTYLLDLGIIPVIPSKENEDRTARPVEFDKEKYRRRNVVERLIGWLKESRRIFSRFEKTAKNSEACSSSPSSGST